VSQVTYSPTTPSCRSFRRSRPGQLTEGRDPDELEGTLTLGPDAEEYLQQISNYDEAGYTHIYFHQIGPDQDGFLKFAKSELLPRL
jgi:coenzyme F420-dependent glucose-6-phosphate dehydrogenase